MLRAGVAFRGDAFAPGLLPGYYGPLGDQAVGVALWAGARSAVFAVFGRQALRPQPSGF